MVGSTCFFSFFINTRFKLLYVFCLIMVDIHVVYVSVKSCFEYISIRISHPIY